MKLNGRDMEEEKKLTMSRLLKQDQIFLEMVKDSAVNNAFDKKVKECDDALLLTLQSLINKVYQYQKEIKLLLEQKHKVEIELESYKSREKEVLHWQQGTKENTKTM